MILGYYQEGVTTKESLKRDFLRDVLYLAWKIFQYTFSFLLQKYKINLIVFNYVDKFFPLYIPYKDIYKWKMG